MSTITDYFRLILIISDHFRIFPTISDYFSITDYFKLFLSIWDYFLPFQTISDYFKLFQTISDYFRLLLTITDYFSLLQTITELFVTFYEIFLDCCFESIKFTLEAEVLSTFCSCFYKVTTSLSHASLLVIITPSYLIHKWRHYTDVTMSFPSKIHKISFKGSLQ